jgi:hypothetical protein
MGRSFKNAFRQAFRKKGGNRLSYLLKAFNYVRNRLAGLLHLCVGRRGGNRHGHDRQILENTVYKRIFIYRSELFLQRHEPCALRHRGINLLYGLLAADEFKAGLYKRKDAGGGVLQKSADKFFALYGNNTLGGKFPQIGSYHDPRLFYRKNTF